MAGSRGRGGGGRSSSGHHQSIQVGGGVVGVKSGRHAGDKGREFGRKGDLVLLECEVRV